jgi:hypothetical protein
LKAFFAALDSTRIIIIASFVGSIVMGVLVYVQRQKLEELERQVGPQGVQRTVVQIQSRALELANLQRIADRETLRQRDDPERYVREAAAHEHVNIGDVDSRPNSERIDTRRGHVDRIITVQPPRGTNRTYTRAQISNFLFKLEADSRRIRVTRIQIRPETTGGRTRPHEVASDRWTFDVDITIRDRVEPR